MTKDDLFERVAQNALGFIDHSIHEINRKNHEKCSLIHFCAAVELFVKARLMLEHWALIVTKPEAANWEMFCRGDFHSVSLRDALGRLKSIVGEELRIDEKECFLALANHRNQLVHFQHPDQDDLSKFRTKVVAEQLRAWFYLHRLLTDRWRSHFPAITKQLDTFDKRMQKIREYLKAKFDALKPEIETHVQAGKKLDDCPSCGFRALVVEEYLGELFNCHCEVCDWTSCQIEFACPDCGNPVVLRGEGRGSCVNCGKDFEPDDVTGILGDPHDAYCAIKDGDDHLSTGNCSLCESMGTLIPYHGKYLCTNCLDVCEERWQCNWCGEYTNQETESGFYSGCFACADAIPDRD